MVQLTLRTTRRIGLGRITKVNVCRTNRNITRILPRGGAIFLICGSIRNIYTLNLQRGQYVTVSCNNNPKTYTVGCTSLSYRLPGIRLNPGDAIFITC